MSGPSSEVVYKFVSCLKTVRGDDLSTDHYTVIFSYLDNPDVTHAAAVELPQGFTRAHAELPVHRSQGLRLTLGEAICFGMDFLSYILQAGAKKVG